MQLFDIFNKPTQWEWADQSDFGDVDAHFMLDDQEVVVAFIQGNDSTKWWLEFGYRTSQGGLEKGITGTGNAFQMFSTVIDIIRSFVQKNNPQTMIFQSQDPSRTKLYDRMVQKLSPSWNVESEVNSNEKTYILTKNENRTRT